MCVCGISYFVVRPVEPQCSLAATDSYLCTWFEHFGAYLFCFIDILSVIACRLLLIVNSISTLHILIIIICFYVELVGMNCERIQMSYCAIVA